MTVLEGVDVANTPQAWSKRASEPEPWAAAGWSEESQRARFERVAAAVNAQPLERLLDFGCGPGGFCDHLAAGVSYVGYDWAPGMVARARRDYPSVWFTSTWPSGGFNAVVCIGTFNLAHNWTKEKTWHTLRHLWDSTGCRVLAVSLYAGVDDRCLIYTEDECRARLSGETFLWAIERWRPNDLLVVLER